MGFGLIALPYKSRIRLDGWNGFGSDSGNVIDRFSTSSIDGSDMTYADSASAGMTITINTPGLYIISKIHNLSVTGAYSGISKNSSALTTSIISVAGAEILGAVRQDAANGVYHSGAVDWLVNGDVIRSHNSNSAATVGSAARTHFVIMKVT